jgi:hypothetical protein
MVSLINFEILDGTTYALTATFSLLTFLGGAHIWLTLAYYTDRRWLAHFNEHPVTFYLAPTAFVVATVALLVQPYKPVGQATLYGLTFLNLWHHSKQNWGILALVGKLRRGEVGALRRPLIYAWPFFLIPWMMQVPELNSFLGHDAIFAASVVSCVLYLAFSLYCSIAGDFMANRDPAVIIFGAALCAYFLPMILLAGKPYAIMIWAAAHGLQYYVMVWASLSLHRRATLLIARDVAGALVALAILVGLTFLSYATTQAVGSGDFWVSLPARAIFGIVLGVNLVHFWVDAFIWKFSNREIRGLHGEAFAF